MEHVHARVTPLWPNKKDDKMSFIPTHFGDEEWELIARNSRHDRLTPEDPDAHAAWRGFIAGNEPPLRTTILESWKRCRADGMDTETFNYSLCNPHHLAEILQSNAELIATARDVMKNLLAYNPDGHINLTDINGITLCFCGQDLTPVGSILTEELLGTNCTGRCLNEKRVVYVLSGENYKQALRERGKHCAAAPVRDASGTMIGVLTLTANRHAFHYHTLGTVQAAAEAIGQHLTLRRLLNEQRTILESMNEGVIVTSPNGTIRELNRYARQVLGLDESVRFSHFDRVLKPEGTLLADFDTRKDLNVTFCPDVKKRIACLISVVKTPDGDRVITLREHRRIRDITRQMMGNSASYTFEMILGNSSVLSDVIHKARNAARSDSTVLLTGESGTGKELFAQSIHNSSDRYSGPFLALNCGAIPRDLVQSELFGYEDGAFTGSRRGGSAGKFELADGGTLFLDEIGDMPLEAQTSLLRVLQENEVMRIGGKRPVKVNIRIIAATHRDLKHDIATGAFRQDLYFRLNIINLNVPPLRDRPQDIPLLLAHFSEHICRGLKRQNVHFSTAALAQLTAYPWPGNVRELENLVERVLNSNEGETIDADDLPEEMRMMERKSARASVPDLRGMTLEEGEKSLILQALEMHRGNLRQSALALNLSRGSLYKKIDKYGIDPNAWRGKPE